MRFPEYLLRCITILKKLPGVGSRTAERYLFHLLDWPQKERQELAEAIACLEEELTYCPKCRALIEAACPYCARESNLLCVVASIKDIFCIEATGEYRGHYHVLGTLLSPLQGQSPDDGVVESLRHRVSELKIEEMILAFDPTLEGDATALFLKKQMEALEIPTTRLALGLPMGSSLDYIDEGTLGRALAHRRRY